MGKAALDKAIGATQHLYDVRVTWLPFFLRPGMPRDGKLPGVDGAPAGPYWHYAIPRARELGIDMAGGVTRFPNTTLAHCLLHWAHGEKPEQQHQLAELIFEAYYAKDLFLDLPNLVSLSTKAGYDAGAAHAYLASRRGEEYVHQQAAAAGVSGVPYFIINGKGVFSGAQDPSAFEAAFAEAARSRPRAKRAVEEVARAALEHMTATELKRLLAQHGYSARHYTEKHELVKGVLAAQAEARASHAG